MRASRNACSASDARLIHHAQEWCLTYHFDGSGRADTDAGKAGDAEVGVDPEVQQWLSRGGMGGNFAKNIV
jgi:hypothetical protein